MGKGREGPNGPCLWPGTLPSKAFSSGRAGATGFDQKSRRWAMLSKGTTGEALRLSGPFGVTTETGQPVEVRGTIRGA